MLAKFRDHLRSHVVAYVALFFALSAPASAAIITGALIKDESLTGADIRNDSLKGADVDEASLAGASITGVNADKLDGKDSTEFTAMETATGTATLTTGNSVAVTGVVAVPAGSSWIASGRVQRTAPGPVAPASLSCTIVDFTSGGNRAVAQETITVSSHLDILTVTGPAVDSPGSEVQLFCVTETSAIGVRGELVLTVGE